MKIIWWTFAFILITLGLATLWLPIPTGVPLMALGVVIVIATSRPAARMLRNRRRRSHGLNDAFVWVEDHTPAALARILRRTRPRVKG